MDFSPCLPLLLVLPLLSRGDVVAQVSQATPPPLSWARSPSDPESLVTRQRTFSGDTTPGLCRAAARMAQYFDAQRTLAAQLGDAATADTVGIGAASLVARTCGARFTLANTPAQDFPELFTLALHEQNDTLALAVLTKLLENAPQAARDHLRAVALEQLLAFGRLAAAQALVAQVDALGAAARMAQIGLHAQMMEYYGQRHPGDGVTDSVQLRAEAKRLLQLGRAIGEGKGGEWLMRDQVAAMQALIRVAIWTEPDAIPALVTRTRQLGRQWRWPPWNWSEDLLVPDWFRQVQHRRAIPAPRLTADYWYPPPGRPQSDTVRPVPGKVNLICLGGVPRDDEESDFQDGSAYQQGESLKHMLAEYGAANLEITLVRPAMGYAEWHFQELSGARLFGSSAEEADLWRWYAQEYAQLPVTVAVQVQHSQFRPPPDGRRFKMSRLPFDAWWQWSPMLASQEARRRVGQPLDSLAVVHTGCGCVIVDRAGTLAYFSGSATETGDALRWLLNDAQAPHTGLTGARRRASPPGGAGP